MERVFAAESPEAAQKGCFAASMGTLIVGIPFAMVAVSTPAILESLGIEAGEVAILYVILEEAVPAWIAALVLAGIFAASLSTGVGAILATSSVFARNLVGLEVEEESEDVDEEIEQDQRSIAQRMDFDLLLWTTRIFFVLVAFGGVFIALRVPATGALLVLAFDLMFATALVPLVFGIYWPNFANKPAALISIVSGATARIVFFVLTPTLYGVENTLLYIPNDILTADWDGLVTILAGAVSLVTFVVVGYATKETHEPQYLDRDPWGAD